MFICGNVIFLGRETTAPSPKYKYKKYLRLRIERQF